MSSDLIPHPVLPTDRGAALEEIAARANRAHENVLSTARDAVDHALVAGQALIEAKRLCPTGTWYAWLAAHFRGSKRTAQAYVRLATHAPHLLGDAHHGAHRRYRELRSMLAGLSPADGRARGTSARPAGKSLVAEVETPRLIAPTSPDDSLLPHVKTLPAFEPVACSLRQTLVQLERLAGTRGERSYAGHLLSRLRPVYEGLATLRWWHGVWS